jgi:hypothetical protein
MSTGPIIPLTKQIAQKVYDDSDDSIRVSGTVTTVGSGPPDISGVQGAITVSSTATAVRVGGANLANRKSLSAFNNGTQTLYWGYTSGVTTSSGTPLYKNQTIFFDIGPDVTVYLIAASATHDVRVTELS